MEDGVTADLVAAISDPQRLGEDTFGLLRSVASVVNNPDIDEGAARDLVIRLLEHRGQLTAFEEVISTLAGRVGLYPYVDEDRIDGQEALAREANRPLGAADEYVFHRAQSYVYRLLLDGHNVILSAPTSFGKSLIIDAVLAASDFRNCAVVVPTLALLDETRRRLTGSGYKVITHSSQALSDRNLFVMTQERLLEYPELPSMDFFAIDEFYKLDLAMDPDRASLLNQAFYRLVKGGGQFYMLGPDIQQLVGSAGIDARFIHAPFRTVALDVVRISGTDERASLMELCGTLDEPTIIYCRSPQRTRTVASWLLDSGTVRESDDLAAAASWVSDNYHPDWLVARALANGVGVHHGRLPRALAHHLVKLFNERRLRYLICTSTLIEGVNTAAKNVVIFDNYVARRELDFFTFNNIRGRSGRMFQHFVGRVFLFHPEPRNELPVVDLPTITQGPDVPNDLLIQLDEEDLLPSSVDRLRTYVENGLLPIEVLRSNSGVDLDAQLAVARNLASDPIRWSRGIGWTGLPTYEQLEATCQLIWDLADPNAKRTGAFTSRQLAWLLNQLSVRRGDIRGLIDTQIERATNPDEAIENALAFVRTWPGHNFPKLLMAVQRIGEAVLPRFGVRAGDYRLYASRVEHLFLPQFVASLEEYGVPVQVTMQIPSLYRDAHGLDDVLRRLGELDLEQTGLTGFETEMLRDAQVTL